MKESSVETKTAYQDTKSLIRIGAEILQVTMTHMDLFETCL